ncbi:undecaprenyldiphospho-muramoylpentapeptide beta-N-acetylglucosaminyltransferase [Magnetofaba australis]|uniref:UDP-N-acetylglucosamine--N-acetylmuramyl-(pentapeptide) pyrophosphoryl-undecaprenol N-acetylglucosamine transferase n=1 Tax=Magnetofaba australis IT-1 TaxID=1434232 RepID=A0A1Y2K8H7_9PROT|nr:undecaprenyldiphospho-muramoylpentapeptide beta-N-acetylglucosaminyltransferase [Magnetofaba australis]OSM07060.1 putative UDP-N-acetylglucosamine--N-acetylmuramyl-(pentapeptide) pyrophosphoryl-UDP N-acetylglucosamine transferase [Magnetofaba australis IT-1]
MAETPSKRLLIAGGGTGGHLYPAIAVAEAWQAAGFGDKQQILFMGASRGIEARVIPEQGYALALIDVGQLKGGGITRKLKTLLGLPAAVWRARKVLKQFKPDVALGVGGYASAPAMAAAWLLGIPCALHEQNARPGLTNRRLAKLAKHVFISFAQAHYAFDGQRVTLTGNPVRAALTAAPSDYPQQFSAQRPLRLLITGGSQGAAIFSEVVPAAAIALAQEGAALQIRQQVRGMEPAELQARYAAAGIAAECLPFIDDMARAYAEADLVIARAGATTVAELALCGKPALLVPYPYAADDHQAANAEALTEAGGGWMQRQEGFTAEYLQKFLRACLENPAKLAEAAQAAQSLGRPEAAQEAARLLYELAQATK